LQIQLAVNDPSNYFVALSVASYCSFNIRLCNFFGKLLWH